MGLTEGEAASILFMCGIGEVLGKIVLYALAGFLQAIPSIYMAIFGNIIDAVFTIGLVLSNTYASAATFVICKYSYYLSISNVCLSVCLSVPFLGGLTSQDHQTG